MLLASTVFCGRKCYSLTLCCMQKKCLFDSLQLGTCCFCSSTCTLLSLSCGVRGWALIPCRTKKSISCWKGPQGSSSPTLGALVLFVKIQMQLFWVYLACVKQLGSLKEKVINTSGGPETCYKGGEGEMVVVWLVKKDRNNSLPFELKALLRAEVRDITCDVNLHAGLLSCSGELKTKKL